MTDDTRDLVQIEANEDANSVRDRLSFLRGKRVLLIWPEEGTALTRKLDLVLIQREAMRRAIRLAIVTHDPEVIKHAQELNISTFETIGASERARWKRARSKVFTNRDQRPKDELEPEALMGVASRVRIKRPSLSRLQSILVRLAVLVLLTGVVAAVAYILIPSATIKLIPAEEQLEASVEITVNSDPGFLTVDVENAIIPGTLLIVEVEDSATISTTGTVDFGNQRAVGSVIFINNTANEITIPAGTTLSTSAGTIISFQTIQDAVLSGGVGQQLEVPIEAMPGFEGDVGNVAENLINTVTGPLENIVTVRNLSPTRGGASRVQRSVTQADLDLALAAVRQQLQNQAYTGMLTRPEISEQHFIILETLQIAEERDDWTTFSHNIGDVTDALRVNMRARVQAVAVDQTLAEQIVFAKIANQILRGRVIQTETIEYSAGPVNISQAGEINFTLTGRGLVTGQIDRGQIQNNIAGQSIEEAVSYIQERVDIAENSKPQITISPVWFTRMPLLPMRINVITQKIVVVDNQSP